MVDGPPAVITSNSTDTPVLYSPMSVASNEVEATAGSSGARPPWSSSSSGGSLPSPAMVTSEARQVLEAFLQRTQSVDRGSACSLSNLVSGRLEVIEEIRHKRNLNFGTEDSNFSSMDALVVETSVPKNSHVHLDRMEVQHRAEEGGQHVTDIKLHYHDNDLPGVDRVVCSHVRHPIGNEDAARGQCAAKVVTESSNEVFIDASISRQASVNDGDTTDQDPSLLALPHLSHVELRGNSSGAHEGDTERPIPSPALRKQVAKEAAATGKKRRNKLMNWFRNLNDSKSDTKNVTAASGDSPGFSDEVAAFAMQTSTDERPPYHTMGSYSSSTSSTASSHGAPTRSLVHPDPSTIRRRKKKRKERYSVKMRQSGIEASSSSVFHQLFATIRYGRKRPVQGETMAQSNPQLDNYPQLSPPIEGTVEMDTEEHHQSLPTLLQTKEKAEVADTFRCVITAGGCRTHKEGQCRLLISDDNGDRARVREDETKLVLDLNSSNSQSSQGGNTTSSPDGVGPDGVASKQVIDSVARQLDEVAKSITLYFDSKQSNRERRQSVPNLNGTARSASRERASSGTRRPPIASDSASVSASASTPMLYEETQKAMQAKARRMKSQSHEDLFSEDLVSQLIDCDTYSHFESLIKRSGLYTHNSRWKQITVLYMLTRKAIRVVRKREGGMGERENTIKDFAMKYFNTWFADFVVRRGGWKNLIETTEDSELD